MLEQIFGPRDLFRRVTVDGKQDTALFDVSFVALGFVFGDAHTYQGTYETADSAAYSEPGKCAHDRTCRDERTDARDRQSADPGQQPQGSSDYATRRNARGGAFRRFCILLMGEVFRP